MNRIEVGNKRRKPTLDAVRRRPRLRPTVSELEGRTLLSTFTVNSTADNGSTGTLRWALDQANASNQAERIGFSSLFNTPHTIRLTGGPLVLSDPAGITITGPGENFLSITGNKASRVISVTPGSAASLSDFTITGGNVHGNGGGIRNNGGTLALDDIVIRGNSAGMGGGLYNNGAVTLTDVTIRGNHARKGGGVFNDGSATLTNVVTRSNTTVAGSGVFSTRTATLTRNGLSSEASTTILSDNFTKNVTGGVPTNWAVLPTPFAGTYAESSGNVKITVGNSAQGSAGILAELPPPGFSPLNVTTTITAQINGVNQSGNAVFGLIGLSSKGTETGYLAAGIDAEGVVVIVEQEAGISEIVPIKKDANYNGGSILMKFVISPTGVEVSAPGYDSTFLRFNSKNLSNFSLTSAFGSGAFPALVAANQPSASNGAASFGSIDVTTTQLG
jgi:hypothetical protein